MVFLKKTKKLGRYPRKKAAVGLYALHGSLLQSLTRAYQKLQAKTIILVLLALAFTLYTCQQKKRPIQGNTIFQKKLNATFKDASTSPLQKKDLKNFNGLTFFTHDSAYIVKAKLKRTPNSTWFNMKTTTDRLSKERVFGILNFQLNGKNHQLNIYQSKAPVGDNDTYLFLPFLDQTNGLESYSGGRYIDANIPKGDILIIDFNTAYNPYCAYNKKYSCPLVPRVNYLETRVEAGVKAFVNH